MQINLQAVFDMLEDVRVRYQREEDQGLRQHDMEKARFALAGKDACDRIKTEIELRTAWIPEQPREPAEPIVIERRKGRRKAGGE